MKKTVAVVVAALCCYFLLHVHINATCGDATVRNLANVECELNFHRLLDEFNRILVFFPADCHEGSPAQLL